MAFLTLPFKSLETAYFDSKKRIYLPGQIEFIRVSISKKDPDAMLVDRLRRTAYVSSEAAAKIAVLREQLSERVPVSQIAFGVWTHPTSLSPEYAVEGDTGLRSTTGSISIWYDDDRRAVHIQRIGHPIPPSNQWSIDSPSVAQQFIPRPLVIALVRNIQTVQLNPVSLSCVLNMRSPVTFENDDPVTPDNRIRLNCFDDNHARAGLSEYTNMHLLVRFNTLAAYDRWVKNLQRIPHIPRPISTAFLVEKADVFAARWVHTLHKWYEELPLQVALYCEQAIRSGALTPEDLLHCRAPLEAAIQQSGVLIAALTMQHLIATVTSPKFKKGFFLDRKKGAERVARLHDTLKEAGEKAVREVRYGARWSGPDIAVCHHVYATPTTMIFERKLVLSSPTRTSV